VSPHTNARNRAAIHPHVDVPDNGLLEYGGNATGHFYAIQNGDIDDKGNIFGHSENGKQTCPMLNIFDLSGFNVRG
jgi:hypothetical protein